jgi:DNA-binding Lrp family transcriptional regulator
MSAEGVIADFAPRIDVAAVGYPVHAFVHLHLAQGQLETVARALVDVPEVLEAYSVAGAGDLLCRVAARDNPHLEEIIQELVTLRGVVCTRTDVALRMRLPYRTLPLLSQKPRLTRQ